MNKKKITVFLTIAVFLASFSNTLYAQESTELTIYDLMQIDEPEQEHVQEKEVEPVPEDNQASDASNEKNDKLENFVLVPVIAPSFGYPEIGAIDVGVEMFWEIFESFFTGFYTLLECSESSDNSFFRLAAGSTTTYLGNLPRYSLRLGGGLGAMPENKKFLLTAFVEATLRVIVFDFKLIYEFPLGPEELKNYYNDNYSPFKFRIGLSNLFFFL
ncbi:MAG: hypothetical protein J5857_05855 [Treponema sp.]|nr:hypothetical protein [Treponema sp.]